MNYLENLFLLLSVKDTDNGFEAVLRCNPGHPVYQVHFPGNPMTPGACLLQTGVELLQRKTERLMSLKSSKNIKYLSVLIPEEGKEVKYVFSHIVADEKEYKTQLVVADEQTVYAKMSLTFSY